MSEIWRFYSVVGLLMLEALVVYLGLLCIEGGRDGLIMRRHYEYLLIRGIRLLAYRSPLAFENLYRLFNTYFLRLDSKDIDAHHL